MAAWNTKATVSRPGTLPVRTALRADAVRRIDAERPWSGADVVARLRSSGPCESWVEGATPHLSGGHGHEWVSFPAGRQRHPEVYRPLE